MRELLLFAYEAQFWLCLWLPTDWRTATAPPATTPPPLATAAADITDEAMDPAAMPPAVKPNADTTSGAATTAPP